MNPDASSLCWGRGSRTHETSPPSLPPRARQDFMFSHSFEAAILSSHVLSISLVTPLGQSEAAAASARGVNGSGYFSVTPGQ